MDIYQAGHYYKIRIPTSDRDFEQLVSAVKLIPGRQWDQAQRTWTVPVGGKYPSVDELIAELVQLTKKPVVPRDLKIEPLPELTVDIPLKRELYPFQKQGVAYNIQKGSSLMADQQGLGKTIQAIASVVAMDLFPCLVITKKTLCLNWKAEWEDCTNKVAIAIGSNHKNNWPVYLNSGAAQVCIVNYESLQPLFIQSIQVPTGEDLHSKYIKVKGATLMFKSVIIDESHYVKDGKTKRTKFCIAITRHLTERGVFLLSGTPALNDPLDLYTQLTILNRRQHFGNYNHFRARYCGKTNACNLRELNYLLHKHCFYRRLKTEAKADLPPKTRQVIHCDIDNREEYQLAEQNFIRYLQEKLRLSEGQITTKLRGEVMVQMGILKKIAAKGKLPAVKEWVRDLIACGEKVVLFAYHQDIQKELIESFDGAVGISSQEITPMQVIQENKRRFQEGDAPVIVCSMSAASEGHTLNAASNMGITELPWHFGKMEQMEDRIHRITNWLPANISCFLAEGTIDRDIYRLIMEKKDMHDALTGTADHQETKVVDSLINLFNQKTT